VVEDDELETVTIEFASDSTPISGVVIAAGVQAPFTGWMELAGLLESAHCRCEARSRARSAKSLPLSREKIVVGPR
jgi:hypothetical protein